MAVRKPGDAKFRVFTDINVLEVVDSGHRMVREGQRGRVLVTNLVNLTLPLIRFDLGDEAILAKAGFGAETLAAIEGKASVRLPVRLADGDVAELPLRDLCGMDATGCSRFQFVSIGPDEVEIHYEASENLDARIEAAFRALLSARRAKVRSVRVCRVPFICNDARTAKHVEVTAPFRPALPLIRLADTTDAAPDPCPSAAVVAADAGFSSIESVFDRFRLAARRRPERIAVEDGNAQMSYTETEASALRIARALLSRGFDPTRPIAVLSSHRAETIPALLGVLAAGGFYLPLDPTMPPERLRAILGETQPEYLLADADTDALRSSLDGIGPQVIGVRALAAPPEAALPRVGKQTPACLLYTTGSTGAPKGVVLSHRSVGSRVASYSRDFGIGAGDRVSLLQPVAVSAAVRDIFGTLLGGATLAVYDVRARGVAPLAGWIRSQGITVLYAVPTLWRLFLEALSDETFPDVRLVRLGGEAVEPRDLEGFRRHFPEGCRLVNGYAATETDTLCHYVMDHETRLSANRVPVGRPVAGMKVDICDDAGSVVLDAIGEIRAAGDSVALGSWDPLARRVVPLPGGPVVTGDLGYRLPDGRIVLTGRRDFMVKIHGYRIDLAAIERAVAGIASGGEAAAVIGPTPAGDTGIAVYYVPAASWGPEAVRRAIEAVLPTSNLRISLVPMSALPRLPGGKVHRHLLPKARPAAATPRPDTDYHDAIEARLAAIWADQLGIGAVPRDADFFALGGDSVTAIRAINRIRQAFGVEVSVSDFFDHSTVAELARLIGR
jgi:amino acid adenylation domain-containing protein